MNKIFKYLAVILGVGYWLFLIFKFLKNKYSPVKTVKAKVIDKYKVTGIKWAGALSLSKYVVVFLVGEKKMSFVVSEFSFAHYKIRQKGTLKYKGSKIIEFN